MTPDRAFSEGSDARLAGEPLSSNPYYSRRQAELYVSWQDGWSHVHFSWGVGVRGRWPIRHLPDVKEVA